MRTGKGELSGAGEGISGNGKESDSRVAYEIDTSSPARSMEHHKIGGTKVAPGAFGSEARSRHVNLDGRSCCNQSSRPDARDGIFSDVGACL